MRIRDGDSSDPGWKKVGSGIRDKHPGSATLPRRLKKRDDRQVADGKGGGEANPTTARKPGPLLTSHYTLPAWICNSIHFEWSPTGSAAVEENTAQALFTLVHNAGYRQRPGTDVLAYREVTNSS
jgi:hypothetical protein